MFQKGDRVRLNSRGRASTTRPAYRLGTYVSATRDGAGDRIVWDGTVKIRATMKGFIELAPEAVSVADCAVDPVGGTGQEAITRDET